MQIAIYGTYVEDAKQYAEAVAYRKHSILYTTADLCAECGYDTDYPFNNAMWNVVNNKIMELCNEHKDLVVLSPYAPKFVLNPYRVLLWRDLRSNAERIVERVPDSSIEDAAKAVSLMVDDECKRSISMYNGYELLHPQRYDLILDVTNMRYAEAATYIADGKSDIYLDRCNVRPLTKFDPAILESQRHPILKVPVHMYNHHWYLSCGALEYVSQVKRGNNPISCYFERYNGSHNTVCDLPEWEKRLGFKIGYRSKEDKILINEEALQNVKSTLFGNQKQANVINDAVVAIVAQYLDGEGVDMSTLESTATGIYETLQEVAHTGMTSHGEMFVQLVAGRKSYDVLKEGLPYIVTQNQPNAESPKINFRVIVVGEEEPEDVVENGEKDVYTGVKFDKPAAAPDEVLNPDDTVAEQVRKLKDAILPMCPDAVKAEISDEYAQALYCAQAYFEYNSR